MTKFFKTACMGEEVRSILDSFIELVLLAIVLLAAFLVAGIL